MPSPKWGDEGVAHSNQFELQELIQNDRNYFRAGCKTLRRPTYEIKYLPGQAHSAAGCMVEFNAVRRQDLFQLVNDLDKVRAQTVRTYLAFDVIDPILERLGFQRSIENGMLIRPKFASASTTKSRPRFASVPLLQLSSVTSRKCLGKTASASVCTKTLPTSEMTDSKNLVARIKASMKEAMKAREKERLATIRLIQAEFKRVEVDERIEIDDARALAIMDKMVKQRRDSISQFESAGRDELAAIERAEINVIQEFLPQQLSEDEILAIIDDALSGIDATGMAAMGPLMGVIKPKLQGRADMGAVSKLVKAKLTS